MKARNTTSNFSRKREVLQEVIPLDAPFWICVDVSSVCNITCNYCVQYDVRINRRKDFYRGIMPLELAKKIVDDLHEFDTKVKVVSFYGWGEPLLNPDLSEIIRYARNSGAIGSVETITNGILLTHEQSNKLIDAGLQRINISVQSVTSDGYYDVCGERIDFDNFVSNIRYMYEHKTNDLVMHIKIGSENPKSYENEKFYQIFDTICDEIFVEQIIDVREDRTENTHLPGVIGTGVFGQLPVKRMVCPYIFFRMMVSVNGQCALCNADWYNEVVVGDVKEQSIREVWRGVALCNLQKKHLRGERNDIELCSKCTNIKYYPTDNIDAYASDLLLKIEGGAGTI